MSDQTSKYAKNIERFRQAVAAHDRENQDCTAVGIGLAFFDLERLGFEEGETLWEGVTIQVDGKATGNFRVLCGLNHGEEPTKEAAVESEVTRAVGVEA